MVTARGWYGEENEELLFNVYRFSIWEDKKFWRWMVVMTVQQPELIGATEMYTKITEMLKFVTCILSQ